MAGPRFAAVGLGECFIDYKSAILVQDTQSAFHPHARFCTASQDQTHRELMYRPLQFHERS
jgi:hypothetical protein